MVQYIKKMSKRVTPANTLSRAERELKMIVRIIRLVSILLSFGLPYSIFMFMSFFNSAPKYCFRIAYLFVDVSLAFVMIALFQNTDPVKTQGGTSGLLDFLVLLGTSRYFFGTSRYFLGTSRYFLVLFGTFWYFSVLSGTSRYFLVLFGTLYCVVLIFNCMLM
jgi:hypothetical protein